MEFEAMDESGMNEVVLPEDSKDFNFPITSDDEFGRHTTAPATEEHLHVGDSIAHCEEEKQADLPRADSLSVVSFDSGSPSKVTSDIFYDPWDQECEGDEETLLAAMQEYENGTTVARESDRDELSNSEEDSHVESFESIKTLQSMADDQGKNVFDPTITGEP